MLLLSLTEDPETGRPIWIIEFDGVLAGRFETREDVARCLRGMGYRIDPRDDSLS
jgi:hypothetical protein